MLYVWYRNTNSYDTKYFIFILINKITENNYNKISYYFSFIKENNNKNIKSFLYELKNLKKGLLQTNPIEMEVKNR